MEELLLAQAFAVHIGLPKTATSYLQNRLLSRSEAVHFIHVRNHRKAIENIQRFLRDDKPLKHFRSDMLPYDRITIISSENISISARFFGEAAPPPPCRIAKNIRRMCDRLLGEEARALAIVTIRRQDTWLASRYAEAAKHMEVPGQADFEQRVQALLGAAYDTHGVWLDYCALFETFERRIGVGRTLFLMQEELDRDPLSWADRLERFLGITGLVEVAASIPPEDLRPNILAAGVGQWRLRNHEGRIELPALLAHEIMQRYEASNRRLAVRFGIDGSQYGYY